MKPMKGQKETLNMQRGVYFKKKWWKKKVARTEQVEKC
jgi:hypothetical protein